MTLTTTLSTIAQNSRRSPASDAPVGAPEPGMAQTLTYVAGDAAEGHGALTAWRGDGVLTRADILEVLVEAGCPEDWAPSCKSDRAHLGDSVTTGTNALIARCAPAAQWEEHEDADGKKYRTREYRVRHVVARNRAHASDVGESLGNIVLIVELLDESSTLHFRHDEDSREAAEMAARIRASYEAALANETYKAGDVTKWLRDLLVTRLGAASFSSCHYVPAGHRATAARLLGALKARWGCGWMHPMIPIMSSVELAEGIARGFADEIDAVARDLEQRRAAVRKRTNNPEEEVAEKTGLRLLRDLQTLDQRAMGYRALCGDTALVTECQAKLARLAADIRTFVSDASIRFGLLDLEGGPTRDLPDEGRDDSMGIAGRRADEALDARRAERAPVEKTRIMIDADVMGVARTTADMVADMIGFGDDWDDDDDDDDATPAPVIAVTPPAPLKNADERFNLIELD